MPRRRKVLHTLTHRESSSVKPQTDLPGAITLIALTVAMLTTACSHGGRTSTQPPEPSAPIRELASPAGPHSAQANLTTGPDGAIYLSWIEMQESGTPALKFAVLNGDTWSPTQTIVAGENLMVNYADFPSLTPLTDDILAAHWLVSIPYADDGYNVAMAFSHDGGKTWSKPVKPHRDSTPTEHGFVSMMPTANGSLGVLWLDSRKLAKSGENGDVAMMYTTITSDGQLGPEIIVDPRVCECCQPSSVRTAAGTLAVYRQRSDQEVRDIGIVRFDGKKWSKTTTVYPDLWHIDACPINGPAIAARGNQVAVAWFTAANEKPRVQLSFSSDGGVTFAAPIQVDDGSPMGRVGAVVLESGSAVVTWSEKSGDSSELRARQIDPNGTRHTSVVVGRTAAGVSSGFPRVALQGDTVVAAWTDTNQGRVRVSAIDFTK